MLTIPVDLGCGILRYEGEDGSITDTLSVSHFRFLNILWLPAPLAELSPAQITVINRFREARLQSDGQFVAAGRAREAFLCVLEALESASILEVGCGKFPLQPVPGVERYIAIEIDEEAVAWCREAGHDVRTVADAVAAPIPTVDAVIAAYVFHFRVSDELVVLMERAAQDDAVLVFNLIADNAEHVLKLLETMLRVWPLANIVKTRGMPRREYWIVMAASAGARRASLASAALRGFWDKKA